MNSLNTVSTALLKKVTNIAKNHSMNISIAYKRRLLFPILNHEALADTADGELLTLFPPELTHEFFWDVDVVTITPVLDYFACVFLHVAILP